MVRPEAGQLTDDLAALRAAATPIVLNALARADAARLVGGAVSRDHDLQRGAVAVLAAGKAAAAMADAFRAASAATIVDALVIGTHGRERLAPPFRWQQASHPVPDERSVAAGRAALALAAAVPPDGRLVVLLSGGTSALMAVPAAGLSLDDKRRVTRRLLAADADIHALNAVRKHLSGIKGGQLAAACAGRVHTLAVSDVVGDDPSVIGSGPTAPDPSTFADALAVVDRCGGRAGFPPTAVARLEAGLARRVAETPKPGDPVFARAQLHVMGSRADAMEGAAQAARQAGFRAVILDEPVIGEARVAAGTWLARVIAAAAPHDEPVAVISSGETTVRLMGSGRGGRNQEFALALTTSLAGGSRPALVLSAGTDGVDGPTDAAGAIVDSTTAARAHARGLDPMQYLDANDSWTFFDALGDLVRTGPTGTNVGDLQVALFAARPAGGPA